MKARISPVCAWRSSVCKSAPAMKIDFFAEVTITPLSAGFFLDEVEMPAQIVQGRSVEDVRARIGPVERQQANTVVTNLAPDQWRRRRRGHLV